MKSIGVFLPGRLESKRLPEKLILPLGDTCLWEIACEKLSKLPDRYGKYVLVMKDSPLEVIAKKFPTIKIIHRDPSTVLIDEPNSEIFKDLKQTKEDFLMFLNPCLVNLSSDTIINALEAFENQDKYSSLTSVKTFSNWLYQGDEIITKVNKRSWSTKEINGYQQAAHCFHIFSKDLLFTHNLMLEPEHGKYVVPVEETIDVDTQHDYNIARALYENSNSL